MDEEVETVIRQIVTNNSRLVTILLVEDNPGHARLIEKIIRRAGVTNEIVRVDDGQKAVDFLHDGKKDVAISQEALLVLLDVNLPLLDGFQVLERIRADQRTRYVPVIMLTTTDNPREIARCYELGCDVYIIKPMEIEQFYGAVRDVGLYLSNVK